MSTYTNKAQQRWAAVIMALAGHELTGMSLNDLASETGIPSGLLFRDLKNLEEVGWARQMRQNWSLTAEIARVSVRVKNSLTHIMNRVNEINREYLEDAK